MATDMKTLLENTYCTKSVGTTRDTEIDAVRELYDDHATLKTLTDELIADHASLVTWMTEADSDLDDICDYLDFIEADGVRAGNYTMSAGAAVTLTGAGFVQYKINGETYYCDLDTTITLADSGDIADTKFGAWRILLARNGTVTTQDTGAQMAFADAETALASLGAVTQTTDTVCIGYLVLENAQGGATPFNIGTTNLNAAGVNTTIIYERGPRKQITGLTAALGSSLVIDAAAPTFSVGTIDFAAGGVRLAQIAAVANQAFDDADTIADTKFGAWLIVTDYAQTGIRAIAADGAVGSVSAMTYASQLAAQAALDALVNALPSRFCPIGQLIISMSGGSFTAGTTNLDHANVASATFTDYTVDVWDRTDKTGQDSHCLNPPIIPASIAQAVLSGLSASGLATLTAEKPADIDSTTT